jgi:2-haloacid dehalogenase
MTREVSALVFDAYGTLFDVHSVTRLAEERFPGKGVALSQAWRTKQLEYTWLHSLMDRYEDFSRITAASLDWAIASLGLVARDADHEALLEAYRHLAPFPEVPAALDTLARARPLAILSNGHPEMLEAVVENAKLRNFFRGGVLSVHAARVFKPHPDVYRIAENRLGVPRSLVGFVSSNGWDAAGARAFGFKTYWVNRAGAPVERLGVQPDAVIANLSELVELLK